MATLSVQVDHAQPRLKRDAQSYVTTGYGHGEQVTDRPVRGYSTYHRSQTSGEDDTWVDPITGTLMLMPLPLLDAWQSTSAGDFARLALGDLTVITSSNWLAHNVNGLASKFIHGKSSTVNEAIRTSATQSANRALYLTCKAANAEAEERALIQVGWDYTNRNGQSLGPEYSEDKAVYIEVWTSGRVDVYLDGEYQGEGSLTPPGSSVQKSVNDEWLRLLLIPMRDGILIYSTNGGGFFWTRPDLEPGQEDAVITPAADVWWYAFGSATVELAPLRYRTSGYRCSLAARWTQAPAVGATEAHYVYADAGTGTATASFVELEDATTAFVPDGDTKACRVKFALTGSGTSTPFVWAAQSVFVQEIEETDDSETKDIENYVHRVSFDVPETGGMTVDLTLTRLQDMEDAEDKPAQLETMTMRPIRLRLPGFATLFDGVVAERPKLRRSTILNADTLELRCEGLFTLLRRFRFADPVPLDNSTVHDALAYIANRAGIPLDRLDIEEFDLVIGEFVRPSKGEFHACIKVGDTAAEWWERIMEEYLPDCHWCEAPGDDGVVRLMVWSPENIEAPTVPYRIFDKMEDARAHLEGLGYSGLELEYEATKRVYRTVDEEGFAPEANSVWVQGKDRRTGRPIVAYQEYPEAADPTVAPSDRVPEWTGDTNRYGIIADALATYDQCADAVERLFKRLAYGRDLMEIEIDMMIPPETGIPLWTGWEIEVQRGRADFLDGDDPLVETWTIKRFGGEFVKEIDGDGSDPDFTVRPCRYVIEKQRTDLPEGTTSLGLGHKVPGRSLREMATFMEHRNKLNFRLRPSDLVPRLSAVEFTPGG